MCVLTVNLDITIINVALGTLAESLGASTTDLQWITAVYMLAAAAFIVVAGVVADRFGRKLILLLGLVVFTVASAMAAGAASVAVLIVARALMGVGSAAILTGSVSIITTMFTGATLRRALASWSTAAALGLPLGPLIGGYLLQTFWWGSIFLINVFICAAVAVCAWFLIPETRNKAGSKVDFISVGLMSLGSLLLTYALIGMESGGVQMGDLVVLVCSVVLFVLFFLRQRGLERPLLSLAVVSKPDFAAPMLTLIVIFFSMAGVLFIVPIYLQYAQHLDVLAVGLRIVPLAVGVTVASLINERILRIATPKMLISCGVVALACGLLLLTRLHSDVSVIRLSSALLLIGLGIGLAQPSALGSCIRSFPAEQHGVASGVVNSFRLLAGSLGIAVTGTAASLFYAHSIAQTHNAAAISAVDRNDLTTEASIACGRSRGIADQHDVSRLVCGSYSDSLGVVFASCAVVALLAVLLIGMATRQRKGADAPVPSSS
ncbi:MFS transporter [Streptomyces sp. NPDC005355]|uniref:MFS transporter n=1 Tax=Streptomyces sp. NPDC005355 TaxID=3157038 RepID=UPI0033B487A1